MHRRYVHLSSLSHLAVPSVRVTIEKETGGSAEIPDGRVYAGQAKTLKLVLGTVKDKNGCDVCGHLQLTCDGTCYTMLIGWKSNWTLDFEEV